VLEILIIMNIDTYVFLSSFLNSFCLDRINKEYSAKKKKKGLFSRKDKTKFHILNYNIADMEVK